MNTRHQVFNRITQNIQPGVLEWIGVREQKRGRMLELQSVQALAGLGLQGDHRCQGTQGSARQVTLISREHIEVVRSLLKLDTISPSLLRRNLVISGINIHALRHQYIAIGEVVFEVTAQCHPCSRMDENLGQGGHAAMLGHGGMCAKIIKSGTLCVGDAVTKLDEPLQGALPF